MDYRGSQSQLKNIFLAMTVGSKVKILHAITCKRRKKALYTKKLPLTIVLALTLLLPHAEAYVDTQEKEDVIIDAPWRTIRDYVPVLFFTPQFHEDATIKKLELYNYDIKTKEKRLIFEDTRTTEDNLACDGVNFIDPNGRTREPYQGKEQIGHFWHYIARVPVDCIGVGETVGDPGEHYLFGAVSYTGLNSLDQLVEKKSSRVLRVVVAKTGFPKFSPIDRYYDAHLHTIAEQTNMSVFKKFGDVTLLVPMPDLTGAAGVAAISVPDPDAANKSFGGPLAMVLEAAYTLGLTKQQLKDGNWDSFKDRIITTDHNGFFSTGAFDSGSKPKFGPTSTVSNGDLAEFNWYRNNFGDLGGEEITLQGPGRYRPFSGLDELVPGLDAPVPGLNLGSHFLAYGAPHFEGPWHGGDLGITVDLDDLGLPLDDIDFKDVLRVALLGAAPWPQGVIDLPTISYKGASNPLTIDTVMRDMSETNGFGYAAHPFNDMFGWSEEDFNRAIGLEPYNNNGTENTILQANRQDFVFKGSQVWNGKNDKKSASKLKGFEVGEFDPLHPPPWGKC